MSKHKNSLANLGPRKPVTLANACPYCGRPCEGTKGSEMWVFRCPDSHFTRFVEKGFVNERGTGWRVLKG